MFTTISEWPYKIMERAAKLSQMMNYVVVSTGCVVLSDKSDKIAEVFEVTLIPRVENLMFCPTKLTKLVITI